MIRTMQGTFHNTEQASVDPAKAGMLCARRRRLNHAEVSGEYKPDGYRQGVVLEIAHTAH